MEQRTLLERHGGAFLAILGAMLLTGGLACLLVGRPWLACSGVMSAGLLMSVLGSLVDRLEGPIDIFGVFRGTLRSSRAQDPEAFSEQVDPINPPPTTPS